MVKIVVSILSLMFSCNAYAEVHVPVEKLFEAVADYYNSHDAKGYEGTFDGDLYVVIDTESPGKGVVVLKGKWRAEIVGEDIACSYWREDGWVSFVSMKFEEGSFRVVDSYSFSMDDIISQFTGLP